jgi:HPt (histidine-containing phosphotransfer) domain-containing protein
MLNARSTPVDNFVAAAAADPIDRAHLFRMTLGDHSLESEVLRLFQRQAGMLLAKMQDADAASIAALAHTLDGSARGIGAWNVSRMAQSLEQATRSGGDVRPAVAALGRAVEESLGAISKLLQVH